MRIGLRAAGIEDAPILAGLHASGFPDAWPAAGIAALLGTPGCFGLLTGEADGFVLARAAADEAEIVSIAVAPQSRRQGLGQGLIAAAAEQAFSRGAVRLFLEVAVDNAAALGLYSSLGFVQAGRRARYYQRAGAPAADALILKAGLPLAGAEGRGETAAMRGAKA